METKDLLMKCVEIAHDKKAQEIISLEMGELTSITDYFLLMTVPNSRLGKSICDYISEETEKDGLRPTRVEGYKEGRWILMDYGSIIVHIFQEEERQYYNLERLWGDAPKESFYY